MYQFKAIIIKVVDGDTVDVRINLGFNIETIQRIRILDLDTPEIYHPSCFAEKEHGVKAKKEAERLLMGKEVVIHTFQNKGKYGRYLAGIYLANGNYADIMKEAGFQKRKDYEFESRKY